MPLKADGFIMPHPYEDPELTPDELERLSGFEPIDNNTVIDAHEFIQNLDSSWMKFIPKEFHHLKEGTENNNKNDDNLISLSDTNQITT